MYYSNHVFHTNTTVPRNHRNKAQKVIYFALTTQGVNVALAFGPRQSGSTPQYHKPVHCNASKLQNTFRIMASIISYKNNDMMSN